MSEIWPLLRAQRGLRSKIARELGITPGAVNQWSRVPPERALTVERVTGISRHVLRPDVFGPLPDAQSREVAAA